MALVDLNTGKIYGCKKGSKVWYHEKAHIKFNDTEFGVKINYFGSFFQMIAVFSIALGLVIKWLPIKLFGLVNAIGMIVCYLYEEIWCERMALKEYKTKGLNRCSE